MLRDGFLLALRQVTKRLTIDHTFPALYIGATVNHPAISKC